MLDTDAIYSLFMVGESDPGRSGSRDRIRQPELVSGCHSAGTRQRMLAAVTMCTRSYLRGAPWCSIQLTHRPPVPPVAPEVMQMPFRSSREYSPFAMCRHPPDSVKQVRQFVGFVGYYRRFIPNFVETAGGSDSQRDCTYSCGQSWASLPNRTSLC